MWPRFWVQVIMIVLYLLVFAMGLSLVLMTLLSTIRVFVLPRGAPDWLSAFVFSTIRRLFQLRLRCVPTYTERDRLMALYAPMSLMALLPMWYAVITLGYTAMFWATGVASWERAITISGSSLLTLGFATGATWAHTLLAFTEATIGLLIVALLIAYLPTMYGVFSRRELAVSQLSSRAGVPPSATEMIVRLHRIGGLAHLGDFWEFWDERFAEIEETHTSLPALVFFRSPHPENSWVTAAGVILDGAALIVSTIEAPREPQAELCLRAGFLALRSIADFFGIEHPPDPHYPADPISISRGEYDQVCSHLAEHGVPLKSDRDQAWQAFAGWRVNYDRVLLALCALTLAPDAMWSSDRAPAFSPSLFERKPSKRR
jgi:hypothetical protein